MFLDNGLNPEQQEHMDNVYESLMLEVKSINPKLYQKIRASELTEKDVKRMKILIKDTIADVLRDIWLKRTAWKK